jgi:hypothetical protein
LIGSQSTYNLANVEEDAVEPPPMDRLHSQYQALLEISEALASHRELDELFSELAPRLHRVVRVSDGDSGRLGLADTTALGGFPSG